MPSGRALGDAFTTLKTATFPKEAEEFKRSLDSDGQFVSGDFPSIFGGAANSGSKTLGEYQASQGRALQRLSIVWKLFSYFWADTIEKAVRVFVNDLKKTKQDEKFVSTELEKFENYDAEKNREYLR